MKFKCNWSTAPVSHLCECSIVGGEVEIHLCLDTSHGCQVALKGALEGFDVSHYWSKKYYPEHVSSPKNLGVSRFAHFLSKIKGKAPCLFEKFELWGDGWKLENVLYDSNIPHDFKLIWYVLHYGLNSHLKLLHSAQPSKCHSTELRE